MKIDFFKSFIPVCIPVIIFLTFSIFGLIQLSLKAVVKILKRFILENLQETVGRIDDSLGDMSQLIFIKVIVSK